MSYITDNGLFIEVVRTKRRKTITISIFNGSVKLTIPSQFSDFSIKELIKKRKSWIIKKLKEEEKTFIPSPKEYVNGEIFTYLGRNYRLKILTARICNVKLIGGFIVVSIPDILEINKIKELLVEWYELHATNRLNKITRKYAKIIDVQPNSIRVRNYKSRWGSCSSKGEISYNWRIIIAPPNVVNYIVVHELCHLIEHNHSKDYWLHVSKYLHDYKKHHKWLRLNGSSLFI